MPPECVSVVDVALQPRPIARAETRLEAGTELWHVGYADSPFATYDRRVDRDFRFSPLCRDDIVLGTVYLGETKEVSIAETLWRQLPLHDARLPLDRVQNRTIGTVRTARELVLVELHDPGLRMIGLRPEQLTQTPASCYSRTRAYGTALLQDHPDVDGFVWMSRHFNSRRSFMLIETQDLQFVPQIHASFTDPEERDDLIRICERAGIDVTLACAHI